MSDHIHIDLAVDADGQRYTTHAFAGDGDPWRGATILTPSVIRDLKARDLLPLQEIGESMSIRKRGTG